MEFGSVRGLKLRARCDNCPPSRRTMNGTSTTTATVPQKAAKPPPPGPAPAVAPPAPPVTKPAAATTANGAAAKGKKKAEALDPATMYESVRNRIAALEEEEVHGEEEERRIGE